MYWQRAKGLALFRPSYILSRHREFAGFLNASGKKHDSLAWPVMCESSETGDCYWRSNTRRQTGKRRSVCWNDLKNGRAMNKSIHERLEEETMRKNAKSKALISPGPRLGLYASGLGAPDTNVPNHASAIAAQMNSSRPFYESEGQNQAEPSPIPTKADTSPAGNSLKASPVNFERHADHCVEPGKPPALA